ncbi:hypothetical protein AB8U03_00790 [Clostridium sp. Mt-5]|uniref:Uncharacterized protein n=1 Tax=Clostridium moutaii TaxID=3240932 RepID=A0ABV4BIY9_9CLOT
MNQYRRDMAEDSRYSFHVWDLLEKYNIMLVGYKNERFICKYDIKSNKFTVENINSG